VLLTLVSSPDVVLPDMSRQVIETIQDWEADIYALVIIGVMLFLPDGLSGASRRLGGWLSRSRPGQGDGR